MKYIDLLILGLSLLLFLRSLSFAITYIHVYGYRDKECIERIRQQQKACDLLNASYNIFVMIIAAFLSAAAILRKFDADSLQTFDMVSLLAISICYAIFFAVRFRLEMKYKLRSFYNDMVSYRLQQNVVTKDNDHEVSFIRGYEKTTKHKLYANLWCCVCLIYLLLC